jgi:hypothetical protein
MRRADVVIKSVEAAKEAPHSRPGSRGSRRGVVESEMMPIAVLSRDQTQGIRISLRSIPAMAAAVHCK